MRQAVPPKPLCNEEFCGHFLRTPVLIFEAKSVLVGTVMANFNNFLFLLVAIPTKGRISYACGLPLVRRSLMKAKCKGRVKKYRNGRTW